MAKINFTEELMTMEVGETKTFPAITYDSVMSVKSRVGFKFGRQYTSERNAEEGNFTVTRLR